MLALAASSAENTAATTTNSKNQKPPRMGGRAPRATTQTKRTPAAKKAPPGMSAVISNSSRDYVPCLYLPSGASEKLLMFFHGNGEDLGMIYSTCDRLRTELSLNILAVEYPNYGVYEDP